MAGKDRAAGTGEKLVTMKRRGETVGRYSAVAGTDR